ncbi:MAG: glutamate decarboxylase [Candidatus Kentron sp. G]|nr:MAG: glutamate decarboxylase [Candidatus Kentron sp. G]VFN06519.1 MAG: glutamate decarboxylase [Candidatus Kentron sp. G]VFN07689.1 MAG: glutamate decarboxylase [Candidatus Kentron sp. G]
MKEDKFTIDRWDVEPLLQQDKIRERTMAIVCVAGSTYTGGMDDIESIDSLLKERGWDIPIHVDGATGGFVCSFSSRYRKRWNFSLPHVKSINVSNHKFGFVYPGLGAVLFREGDYIPEELIFNISYLGGTPYQDYTLNFSRGSGTLWAQYYNLLRLGMRGYIEIIHRIMETTDRLVNRMVTITDDNGDQVFTPLSACTKVDHGYKLVFPIIVLQVMGKYQAALAQRIQNEIKRIGGWVVPAYQLMSTPAEYLMPERHKLPYHVVRIMVKENFSEDMADIIYETTKQIVNDFYKQDASQRERPKIEIMFRLTC